MTTGDLYGDVWEQLLADTNVAAGVGELVVAALDGDAALADTIAGDANPAPRAAAAPATSGPLGAYLARLVVTGFRGIGDPVTLDLAPEPGLVLVVGRNGSGKSSLAEGLETLLTGDSARWAGRKQKAWRDGWRNLHRPTTTRLAATFELDGRKRLDLERRWVEGAALDAGELRVAGTPDGRAELDRLGWKTALTTFRPMLSYSELGGLIEDGPSQLYDQLQQILGLGELSEAAERLRQKRLALAKVAKESEDQRKALLSRLQTATDPRAAAARALLAAKRPDLAALGALAAGTDDRFDPAETSRLRTLATHPVPDDALARTRGDSLLAALAALDAATRTAAGSSQRVASLLRGALDWHAHAADADCPVCGTPGVLDAVWRARAAQQIDALTDATKAIRAAEDVRTQAITAAQAVVGGPLPPLGNLVVAEPDRAAIDAWFAGRSLDAHRLAAHLTAGCAAAAEAITRLRAVAAAELETLHADWRPLADALTAWMAGAATVAGAASTLDRLDAAEAWLKTAIETRRDERFAPIAAHAQEIWDTLRTESNVSLARPRLEGASTRRRVTLDVSVDGTEGVALGVMSQGELHGLALSLFLPRLLLDQSPFRFLVLDDPVQSMDPAKVHGLARVLEKCARTRQVVVFTHDARLLDAVHTMGIRARVVSVSRRPGSVVAVAEAEDPVYQHLQDARAVAYKAEILGPRTVDMVVPGLCRLALEAALLRVARKRLRADGVGHVDIEDRIRAVRSTMELAALAWYASADRGSEVYPGIKNRFGAPAVDTFKELKEGAHAGGAGDPLHLVDRTRTFVDAILAKG